MANQRSENVQVTSYNQSGGITAQNVVINNISSIPQPIIQVNLENSFVNRSHNGKYISNIFFSLNSPYAIGNLYLEVRAKTIESMECSPRKGGAWIEGMSGKRDGLIFTNLQNAFGEYVILIVTSEADEEIEIIYNIG